MNSVKKVIKNARFADEIKVFDKLKRRGYTSPFFIRLRSLFTVHHCDEFFGVFIPKIHIMRAAAFEIDMRYLNTV